MHYNRHKYTVTYRTRTWLICLRFTLCGVCSSSSR